MKTEEGREIWFFLLLFHASVLEQELNIFTFEGVKNDATWRSENLDCILSPQAYLH
jgi:hypothetical protein